MNDPKQPKKPVYLGAPASHPSRREVLEVLATLGAVAVATAPSIAEAATWTEIPHGEIIEMAMTDANYRTKLLANPKKTLTQINGLSFPANVTVVVVTDTLAQIHAVLSSEPGMRGPEIGVVGEILTAYRTNPAFRQQMLADPKAAFEAWTGAVVPEALHVVAVQETKTYRVIQLPAAGTLDLETLADVRDVWADEPETEASWWTPAPAPPPTTVTITSAQACNCWSLGSQYESQAPNCCFDDDPPEPVPENP
ncbi:MAG: hypothetical protein IPH07_16605 [Deltaproteobacteria bacterium]|nr:hypothetical protein [Deltaproteobacteria bacterium]MBK8720257.1 hypothetical protein [Deltaproteobacteria bacterium]MBP7287627.1 hypothetical protein [Nannocystaceae bacterium]